MYSADMKEISRVELRVEVLNIIEKFNKDYQNRVDVISRVWSRLFSRISEVVEIGDFVKIKSIGASLEPLLKIYKNSEFSVESKDENSAIFRRVKKINRPILFLQFLSSEPSHRIPGVPKTKYL